MNAGPLIAAAVVGVALWAAFRKPAAASTPPPCGFADGDKVDAWGKARDLYVVWRTVDAQPFPTWASMQPVIAQEWPEGGPTQADTVVITVPSGKVWEYKTGAAVESVTMRADYCAFGG